jgi:hypothetical protein
MLTVPFVSSIRLVPELLAVPTRIRLPSNHQTRMTENALEFAAEVPADLESAESERLDFLYAITEAGREPSPIKGYTMEISPYAANEWLRSLDPLHTGVRELAFVKYTPRIPLKARVERTEAHSVQAA